ncbi:hypothetical protein [Sphingosinicella terrae]|uniref:hypothetical protein n=1 Tax=Sphingosinicella terrae TaxID=2172047 RepID=UPI000E0D8543|nr:hypothetical protein [Sphingosinicella terrae]
MQNFNRELAISLILDGYPPATAVGVALGGGDPDRFDMVVHGGALGDAPDPACVAARLHGIDPLTREEVERALDACS